MWWFIRAHTNTTFIAYCWKVSSNYSAHEMFIIKCNYIYKRDECHLWGIVNKKLHDVCTRKNQYWLRNTWLEEMYMMHDGKLNRAEILPFVTRSKHNLRTNPSGHDNSRQLTLDGTIVRVCMSWIYKKFLITLSDASTFVLRCLLQLRL